MICPELANCLFHKCELEETRAALQTGVLETSYMLSGFVCRMAPPPGVVLTKRSSAHPVRRYNWMTLIETEKLQKPNINSAVIYVNTSSLRKPCRTVTTILYQHPNTLQRNATLTASPVSSVWSTFSLSYSFQLFFIQASNIWKLFLKACRSGPFPGQPQSPTTEPFLELRSVICILHSFMRCGSQ